jgi:hypothetical protein
MASAEVPSIYQTRRVPSMSAAQCVRGQALFGGAELVTSRPLPSGCSSISACQARREECGALDGLLAEVRAGRSRALSPRFRRYQCPGPPVHLVGIDMVGGDVCRGDELVEGKLCFDGLADILCFAHLPTFPSTSYERPIAAYQPVHPAISRQQRRR